MIKSKLKLDFVAIGPQRTGTSWLDRVLREHPSLCLPQNVKETMFFERYYDKGWEWYASHFTSCLEHQYCGEVAPTYFHCLETIDRIYQINPNCKIIINLRHPVDRAVSLYRHYLARGQVYGSFEEAASQTPRIIEAGKYATYIPYWLEKFGRDNIYIVLLEDIETQPQKTLDSIAEFLEVNSVHYSEQSLQKYGVGTMNKNLLLARLTTQAVNFLRANRLHKVVELGKNIGLKKIYSGRDKTSITISPEQELELQEKYKEDIVFIEKITKRDLSQWRQSIL